MAGNDVITLNQLRDFAQRADQRLDTLEQGKADKVTLVSISIPVSAWTENADTATVAAGFAYYADVAVSGLTANDITESEIDVGSLEVAKVCGMSSVAVSYGGKIRYYAEEKPTAALSLSVRIIQGKS